MPIPEPATTETPTTTEILTTDLKQENEFTPKSSIRTIIDIDNFDLRLIVVLYPYNNHHIRPETTTTTQTLVSSQNPKVDTCAQKPDVGEDADFKHGSWVSIVEFVNVDWGGSGMLDQVELIKMLEKEVRAEQEWHGDGNLTDEHFPTKCNDNCILHDASAFAKHTA
ncbi:hypothetical protein Tco_1099866 [Tanacetum coccineum]